MCSIFFFKQIDMYEHETHSRCFTWCLWCLGLLHFMIATHDTWYANADHQNTKKAIKKKQKNTRTCAPSETKQTHKKKKTGDKCALWRLISSRGKGKSWINMIMAAKSWERKK